MKITVIATGKCKEKAVNSQVDEFIKRLKPYLPTKIIEVPQTKAQTSDQIKEGESKAQLAKVPDGAFVIALDERGETPTTRQFSQKIEKLKNSGTGEVVFIIGGADGLHENVKNRANMLLSLSKFTFPHMMVRPIILEQIYRVGTLLAGHPYHRD